MRKLLLILIVLIGFRPAADACVGRSLNIGVINSTEGQLLSNMITTLINERTGTTVNIKFYKTPQEFYEAVRLKQVDISIENTVRAMQALKKPIDSNAKRAYETVKLIYEKEKGLVWLKPFGFLNGAEGQSYTAPVLRVEVLNNFPALPRVMDKLAGVVNDEIYAKLIKSVGSGENPHKVARDFLKSKKLI